MIEKPVAERTGTNEPPRTASGRIRLHTRWMYGDNDDCICCPGKHAFSRGGYVKGSSWPARHGYDNDVANHLHRAIASFGDDVELNITVGRADEPTAEEEDAHTQGIETGMRRAFQAALDVALDHPGAAERMRTMAAEYGIEL